MLLHKRKNTSELPHIDDFPIVFSYNYLGITISNNGKINIHNDKIKQTVLYILNKVKWASQHCSVRKKILLWKCYLRPYFLYVFPIFDLIPKSTKQFMFNLWKKLFKRICHFHKCTPDEYIYKFTDNPGKWRKFFTYVTHNKIMKRYLGLPQNYDNAGAPAAASKPAVLKVE